MHYFIEYIKSFKNLKIEDQTAELKSRAQQEYLRTMTFKDLKNLETQLISQPGTCLYYNL
jgi:hypothetical protein